MRNLVLPAYLLWLAGLCVCVITYMYWTYAYLPDIPRDAFGALIGARRPARTLRYRALRVRVRRRHREGRVG